MRVNFPEKFGDDSANYFHELARKVRLQCRYLVTGDKDTLEQIAQVDNWQVAQALPKNFDSTDVDNYIKRIEISFESLCTSMEELGVAKPGDLSVFQFYTKLTYFEKKKLKQAPARK